MAGDTNKAHPAVIVPPVPIKRPPKKDAAGNAILPAAAYYIQDSRQIVGNCLLWWAKDRAGYTCEIELAGVYSGEEILGGVGTRETDIPYPAEAVDRAAIRHVRPENLRREMER